VNLKAGFWLISGVPAAPAQTRRPDAFCSHHPSPEPNVAHAGHRALRGPRKCGVNGLIRTAAPRIRASEHHRERRRTRLHTHAGDGRTGWTGGACTDGDPDSARQVWGLPTDIAKHDVVPCLGRRGPTSRGRPSSLDGGFNAAGEPGRSRSLLPGPVTKGAAPVETDSLLERRYRVSWAQLAAVLRQAFAPGARRGGVVVRRPTAGATSTPTTTWPHVGHCPPRVWVGGAEPPGQAAPECPHALSRRGNVGGLCRAAHVSVRR